MPVVTMMTFQLGVSGVASRSRLTTPTRRSVVPRISSAIGRIASVFPVPVPATMPNPLPAPRELANLLAVLALEQRVDVQPTASSIVSHAARVGAMTMTRPVGGSAAAKASRSGGR